MSRGAERLTTSAQRAPNRRRRGLTEGPTWPARRCPTRRARRARRTPGRAGTRACGPPRHRAGSVRPCRRSRPDRSATNGVSSRLWTKPKAKPSVRDRPSPAIRPGRRARTRAAHRESAARDSPRWKAIGMMRLRSGRRLRPAGRARRRSSADRYRRAVDLAAVGDRAVHPGQRRGRWPRRWPTAARCPAAACRPAPAAFIPGKYIDPKTAGHVAARRCRGATALNTGLGMLMLRSDDLGGVGRRARRRPAQMQAVGVQRLGHLDAEQLPHARCRSPHGPARTAASRRSARGRRACPQAGPPGPRRSAPPCAGGPAVRACAHRCSWDSPARCRITSRTVICGLAVGAELGPVLGDRRVVVDQTAVDQPVDDRRGHPLGRREHHRRRCRPTSGARPRRSDHPVHTSTTGSPSR